MVGREEKLNSNLMAQSAEAVEYSDWISAEE